MPGWHIITSAAGIFYSFLFLARMKESFIAIVNEYKAGHSRDGTAPAQHTVHELSCRNHVSTTGNIEQRSWIDGNLLKLKICLSRKSWDLCQSHVPVLSTWTPVWVCTALLHVWAKWRIIVLRQHKKRLLFGAICGFWMGHCFSTALMIAKGQRSLSPSFFSFLCE